GPLRHRDAMTYVRRYRMEIDVADACLAPAELPHGYSWIAWHAGLSSRHAAVKYHSFRDEIDARVFPCLGDLSGCKRLMQEIVRQDTFLADATWLIKHD